MHTITTFFKKIYYMTLLLADSDVSFLEKISTWFKMIFAIGVVAYTCELFNAWFQDNHKFVAYFCLAVVFNMVFGAWKHVKLKTFNWGKFFYKTIIMLGLVIIVYYLLYMIADIASDSFIADGFKITIQITTLFYPVAKAIKSIHIISNGEHPPKWVMDKVYNFEKDGDVEGLISNNKNDENETI